MRQVSSQAMLALTRARATRVQKRLLKSKAKNLKSLQSLSTVLKQTILNTPPWHELTLRACHPRISVRQRRSSKVRTREDREQILQESVKHPKTLVLRYKRGLQAYPVGDHQTYENGGNEIENATFNRKTGQLF